MLPFSLRVHEPRLDEAHVLSRYGLQLREPRLSLLVQLLEEGVADEDLVLAGLGHQARRHVDHVPDRGEAGVAERSLRDKAQLSHADPDVDTVHRLDPVDATLPFVRDGVSGSTAMLM